MNRRTLLFLHFAAWLALLLTPLAFISHNRSVDLVHYLMNSVATLVMMGVFYINYLWLTPRHFVTRERRVYWLVNVVLCLGGGLFTHLWINYVHSLFDPAPVHIEPSFVRQVLFVVHNVVSLVIVSAVATAIQLAVRWRHSEDARLKAEAAHAEAELRNLRNQVSPHFLLNTLNNIYALAAFDARRAQNAIQQLSKMLRHMLYDNQQQEVALSGEVEFLRSYISLMKIRQQATVDVTFTVSGDTASVKVAPLLFISLVENAFKHGISPTAPSFIHISIAVDAPKDGGQSAPACTVAFCTENSNHPKSHLDHSGHGIGLTQVQRRLDLSYPHRYQWEHGPSADGAVYRSLIVLTISTNN